MGTNRFAGLTQFAASMMAAFMLCAVAAHSAPKDPKKVLFQEATEQMEKAKAAQADIFSPVNFKTGIKNYQAADEGFQKGLNLNDIQKKLKMATVYFMKSIETTKTVLQEFKDCVKARSDALAVEAPRFRSKEWEEVESAFYQAVQSLEEGNMDAARSKSRKAERDYRQIELEAIKANYLDETRKILAEAGKSDVRKKAPATLEESETLVAQAEKLLIENRYDTDQVRLLAKEANYEARHALFLAGKVKQLEEEKKTLESVLLDGETPIQKIADKLDVNVKFDNGVEQPTDEILQAVWALQSSIPPLKQEIADKDAQISALSSRVADMEKQLGTLKTKEESLSKLIEMQRVQREKYERVEKLFTTSEAQVLRTGDHVIIRLYGLSFPVGKSTIESQYFSLLSKVVDAFKEYPECTVVVEGHTDSYGTDETNQRLSMERADAVRNYLIATSGLDAYRITALGYGESKPVASNETEEGRRKNRRIDILIQPEK
ncbi:OmpA family protein [bacterium]|nr:OmpA family protein [bacterium]